MTRIVRWNIYYTNYLILGAVFSTCIFFIFVPHGTHQAYAISYNFTSPLSLTSDTTAKNVKISTQGSNVYAVWQNGTSLGNQQIIFVKSTNNGTSFGNTVILNNSTSKYSTNPQIASFGNNIYIVWQNGTSSPGLQGTILFRQSLDGGQTFNAKPTVINRTNIGHPINPQITTSQSNVYITWQSTTSGTSLSNIFFKKSTNNGTSFSSTPINISNDVSGGNISENPKISAFGSNVYITWDDDNTGSGLTDIFFAYSNNNGVSFNSQDLSNANDVQQTPQIATYSSKTYVIWQSADSAGHPGILLQPITNNGTVLGTLQTLSSSLTTDNPELAVIGSSVVATWQDTSGNNDIFVSRSINSGGSFNSPVNLSQNSGVSDNSTLSITSSYTNVVWRDKTSGNGDIFFKTSINNGTSFGSLVNISHDTTVSELPQITSNNSNVFVAWRSSGILFSSGTPSIDISFNSTQYKLSNVARINVTDPSSNLNSNSVNTISVIVTSSSDSVGITKILSETGVNTGNFTGTITFTTGASSGNSLHASPGDTIIAKIAGRGNGAANIFPRTVQFDAASHNLGENATITVTDQNSNLNPSVAETISVHVTSPSQTSGIDLTLKETGPNTGIFAKDVMIFMQGNYLFSVGSTSTIQQKETCCGHTTDNTVDSINAAVTSGNDRTGINPFVLTETGPNTGIFQKKIIFTSGATNSSAIKVTAGSIVSVTYSGAATNGLIIPNSNSSLGALQTDIGQTVTASYLGTSGSLTIISGPGGGGGGGGLIRPGFVLDAIASLSVIGGSNSVSPSLDLSSLAQMPGNLPENIRQEVLHHDPTKPLSPEYDSSFDYPLSIDGGGYVLGGYSNEIIPVIEKTGVPIDVKLNIPATDLQHLALYTNLRGKSTEIENSDTYIIYEKGQPLKIVDPHGYFDQVKFGITTEGIKNKIDYTITFANPMDKSNIILRTWNDRFASSDVKINDALQVVEVPKLTSSSELSSSQEQQISIPQNQIPLPPSNVNPGEDTNVLSTIKDWGGYSSHPISNKEFLDKLGINAEYVPKWFMKTPEWVVKGDLSTQEFVNTAKYLFDHKIIK